MALDLVWRLLPCTIQLLARPPLHAPISSPAENRDHNSNDEQHSAKIVKQHTLLWQHQAANRHSALWNRRQLR